VVELWGPPHISVSQNNKILLHNEHPIDIEIFSKNKVTGRIKSKYNTIEKSEDGFIATGTIPYQKATFQVFDRWRERDGTLTVDRELTVQGSAPL